jgi:Ca2+-binding EF-hand superfamily protein
MNMFKKTAIIGISVIALQTIISVANASTQEGLLTELDKDLDGLISLKEAANHIAILENFNTIDINEDGYISMDELIVSDLAQE